MVEHKNTGNTDEEADETLPLNAQNEKSDVRFQEKQSVFEKIHNEVVGHQGVDGTNKALTLCGHDWVRMSSAYAQFSSNNSVQNNYVFCILVGPYFWGMVGWNSL